MTISPARASLQEQIRQRRPFQSLGQEATLNLLSTASAVSGALEQVLRPFDLSIPQYNVLRILRGADNAALTCGDIRSRLVTRMPDVTRLLDRMERSGLVRRERPAGDRRQVLIALTPTGLALLDTVDPLIASAHHACFNALDDTALRTLITMLTEVRNTI